MTSTQHQLTDNTSETLQRQKRAAWTLATLGGALGIITTFGLISQLLASEAPQPLNYIAGYGSAVAILIGAYLSQRGKVILGVSLAVAVTAIGNLAALSISSGLASFYAILAFIIFALLVSQTFPAEQVGRASGILAVISFGLILVDTFWPVARVPVARYDIVIFLIIGAVIALAATIILLRNLHKLSLGGKLILASLLVALLPLATLAVLNTTSALDTLEEDANRILLAAATQAANSVDEFVSNGLTNIVTEARLLRLTETATLLERRNINATQRAIIVDHLNAYRDKDPLNIVSVALLNENGDVAVDTRVTNVGRSESDRTYFQMAVATGRAYVSQVEFSPDNGQPYLYFSYPVLNPAGEIVGVLRTQYQASILQDLVAQSTGLSGGQSFAVLFDENQLQLAHGTAPEALYKTVDTLPQERVTELQGQLRLPPGSPADLSLGLPDLATNLSSAQQEPFFTAEDMANNTTNQVAGIFLDNQPWLLTFFVPQEVFLAPVATQIQNTVLLATIIAAIFTVGAVVVSRVLLRPIVELTNAATEVAQGNLAVRAKVTTGDEIGLLATTFNNMANQLGELIGSLEQRVQERTEALATSAEVSRRLTTILDEDELVRAVVQQVRDAFDYYHVHIYLFDKKRQRLIMTRGTGQAGQQMLAAGHSIAPGQGLVGRAATTNTNVLAKDVSQVPEWLPNPLLPETRAETAVPIALGDDVLGVLDVQDNQTNGLQEIDTELLRSIANQVAIALRNARLYKETQRQVQREATLNQINQAVLGTTTVQEALQVALREIGRATGASEAHIRLQTTNGHSHPAPVTTPVTTEERKVDQEGE